MRLPHLDEKGRSSVSMINGHVSVWPCGINGIVTVVQCRFDLRFYVSVEKILCMRIFSSLFVIGF